MSEAKLSEYAQLDKIFRDAKDAATRVVESAPGGHSARLLEYAQELLLLAKEPFQLATLFVATKPHKTLVVEVAWGKVAVDPLRAEHLRAMEVIRAHPDVISVDGDDSVIMATVKNEEASDQIRKQFAEWSAKHKCSVFCTVPTSIA